MMWIRLAIRNVWKNRRRSIITVLAIMIGLTAVNLFQGVHGRLIKRARPKRHSRRNLGTSNRVQARRADQGPNR